MKSKKLLLLTSSILTSLPIVVSSSCQQKSKDNKKEEINNEINHFASLVNDINNIEELQSIYTAANNTLIGLRNKAKMNNDEKTLKEIQLESLNLLKNIKVKLLEEIKKNGSNSDSANAEKLKTLELALKAKEVELAGIQNDLNSANSNLELKDNEIESLNKNITNKIKELEELNNSFNKIKEEINKLTLKRNNISAKDALVKLINFASKEYFSAYKEVASKDDYDSAQSLIGKLIDGNEKTLSDIEQWKENNENFKHFQLLIRYYLNKITTYEKYFENKVNVVVNHPKEEFMDVLIDWRIQDLNRNIAELEKRDETEYPNKTQNIQLFKEVRDSYVQIKEQSTDFYSQIKNFSKAEELNLYKHILDPLSSLLKGFRQEFRFEEPFNTTSEWPLYKKIIDTELLAKVNVEAQKVFQLYQQFFTLYGKNFINSVYYSKQYNVWKENVNSILHLEREIDARTEKELLYYVEKSKAILVDMNNLILKAEQNKEHYTNLVTEELRTNKRLDNGDRNFYGYYFDEIRNKALDGYGDPKDKNYEDFNNQTSERIGKIRRMPTSTFTEAFDRYIAFQLLVKETKAIKFFFDFWTNMGEDPKESPLKELLGIAGGAEKIQKRIQQQEEYIITVEESLNFVKDKFKLLKPEFTGTTQQDKIDYLKSLVSLSNTFKTTFLNALEDGGKLFYVFSPNLENSIKEKINNYDAKVLEVNNDVDNKNDDELNQLIQNVNQSYQELVNVLGQPTDGEYIKLFEKLNYYLVDENYELYGDDYEARINAIKEKRDALKQFYVQNVFNTVEEVRAKIDSLKTISEELNEQVLRLFEYNGVLGDIDGGNGFKDDFKLIYSTLKDKIIEAFDNKSETKEQLENRLKEISEFAQQSYNSFGIENAGTKNVGIGFIYNDKKDQETQLESLNQQLRNANKLSYVVPGQELYVLIRYFNAHKSEELKKLYLEKSSPDKIALNLLNKEMDKIFGSDKYEFISRLSDNDISVENNRNPRDVLVELLGFEFEYGKALYEMFLAKMNNPIEFETKKQNLISKRQSYYEYLNNLKNQEIYVSKGSSIKFNIDKYSKNYDTKFLPFHLAQIFAKTYSIYNVLDDINEKYIK
ncbi:coiled-coil domain-containing protein [Mycoplasmopsis lipofaciens]|uniref:coiled-coil domain-containing protein n=1 Tax=Mycoplasmopsis lipofaciens TaxID=114884 RepID=UPI0004816E22|nr:hypothetical protein [Mycoplasmopsis lipofaciens]